MRGTAQIEVVIFGRHVRIVIANQKQRIKFRPLLNFPHHRIRVITERRSGQQQPGQTFPDLSFLAEKEHNRRWQQNRCNPYEIKQPA